MTLLHNTDSARKATETHRIIAKAIEDQRCGLSVDDNQLARQYPHLMPELAEQLIRLRKIVQAAHNVRGQPQAKIADEAGVDEAFQEELDVLRAVLSDYEFLDRVQHGGQGVVNTLSA